MSRWPRTGRLSPVAATLKQCPEDFVVAETLGFQPDGDGEHLYLLIEKRGWSTRDLTERLASCHGLATVDVGYAGMKDKQAVTSQWFSLRGVDGPSRELACLEGVRVLDQARHSKKLRRGELASNRFSIRLRSLAGEGVEEVLGLLAREGAPNYFGAQRFGGSNLSAARRWLERRRRSRTSRFRQGLYLSVLRSYLFNEVLAARVSHGSWCERLDGDVLLGGEPTGPLWGRGLSATGAVAAEIEQRALAGHQAIRDGLEHAGARQDRRRLTLKAEDLRWELDGRDLCLEFTLAAGGYATSFLGDVFCWREAAEGA